MVERSRKTGLELASNNVAGIDDEAGVTVEVEGTVMKAGKDPLLDIVIRASFETRRYLSRSGCMIVSEELCAAVREAHTS